MGRRLAYDAAKGRLWVVCPRCQRWNLTPLEERWEAIEECERHYRDTRLRAATDNVGLARLREGLELVRIGRPLRPEFAAWRWGGQLAVRRRTALTRVAAGTAVGGTLVLGAAALGVFAAIPGFFYMQGGSLAGPVRRMLDGRRVAHLRVWGHLRPVTRGELDAAELRPTERPEETKLVLGVDGGLARFEGDEFRRTSGLLLPKLNRFGATRAQIADAVREIERVGDPARYAAFAARVGERTGVRRVSRFPLEARLALEMAAHEESERRALEGELAALEQSWKDAEEIAAIADDLFLPAGVSAALERLRGR